MSVTWTPTGWLVIIQSENGDNDPITVLDADHLWLKKKESGECQVCDSNLTKHLKTAKHKKKGRSRFSSTNMELFAKSDRNSTS